MNGPTFQACATSARCLQVAAREVADGALWALEHPDATREELLEALMARVHGAVRREKCLVDAQQSRFEVGCVGHDAAAQHVGRTRDVDDRGQDQSARQRLGDPQGPPQFGQAGKLAVEFILSSGH